VLSPFQLQARDGKLTASRVACLMTGDPEKILDLWRMLTGDPDYEEEDLSHVWAVQLGSFTESLSLDWYERRTGRPLLRRGDVVVHPEASWAAATLDAWDADLKAPVECKHVGGFEKTATIIERYQPQAHWQMIVTGAKNCAFSIIEGAREPIIEIVQKDQDYANALWGRAQQFMECVRNLTPPVAPQPMAAPVKAEKIYQMDGNNAWGANAATWITTRQAFKDNEAATKEIKAMVPADAVKCIGHGLNVSRSKSGSLTIKEA
jgi:predicted phage-related endonuclease